MLDQLHSHIKTCGKKARVVILILLGLFSVLALPPFGIWPAAFIALSGLVLFLETAINRKSAFWMGWLYGVGFFGGGLYWLTNAFLVNADKHGWLVPVAVPALAGVMGLFIGLTTLLAFVMWRGQTAGAQVYGRIILFAVAWTFLEWVRSWFLTGFPWNMMATIWGASDDILQNVAWFGSFGLSFFTVLGASSLAALVYVKGPRLFFASVAVLTIPALLWYAGFSRIAFLQIETHEGVVLRLVQPNIPQATKWKHAMKAQHFDTHLRLSVAPFETDKRPSHVIWPETAVTYPITRQPAVARAIGTVVPSGGAVITGVPRMTPSGVEPFKIWNSLMAINELGQMQQAYDKFHLVPFGEYIPLRGLIPIPKITEGTLDFSAGLGPETLAVQGLPSFSPLICYEVIFPHEVVDPENRPHWLLNLTNDGWYGDSPGPYQHLLTSRLRSIEEGMPLVRVANTGISVVTDAYGRVRETIPYGVQAVLDVDLPKRLEELPLAAQYGHWIWVSLLSVFLGLGQFILHRFRQ